MNEKIPADLGLKIGTPKEVIWTRIKKQSEEQLLNMEIEKVILENNIELATKGIEKESKK